MRCHRSGSCNQLQLIFGSRRDSWVLTKSGLGATRDPGVPLMQSSFLDKDQRCRSGSQEQFVSLLVS